MKECIFFIISIKWY